MATGAGDLFLHPSAGRLCLERRHRLRPLVLGAGLAAGGLAEGQAQHGGLKPQISPH